MEGRACESAIGWNACSTAIHAIVGRSFRPSNLCNQLILEDTGLEFTNETKPPSGGTYRLHIPARVSPLCGFAIILINSVGLHSYAHGY